MITLLGRAESLFLPDMRVPKVYRRCKEGDEKFLHMERIEGVMVEKRWTSLSASAKPVIAEQLNLMISSMKRMKHTPENSFVGQVSFPPYPFTSVPCLRLIPNQNN